MQLGWNRLGISLVFVCSVLRRHLVSFSKVLRDRIRAGKSVLLGVGMFTTSLGSLNPDAEILDKLNELPVPYAQLLLPLSAYPEQNAELLAEFGANALVNTELVAVLNAPNVPDADLLDDPGQVNAPHQAIDPNDLFFFRQPQPDFVIATRSRMQYFGARLELSERRDHFNISRIERMLLQLLLPALRPQFRQSSGQVIELEISSQTLFLLLKWIRGQGLYLGDYRPQALQKIRSEAEALKCHALVKQIDKFENRFKS